MIELFLCSILLISFLGESHYCHAAENCPTPSHRKAWRDLTCSEQDDFLAAVTALKNSGIYDEFVRIHYINAKDSHWSPEFLPWHRWYIYQYEKALQQYSNSCVTLPYWDWEKDYLDESSSSVLGAETFGSYKGTSSVDGRSCTNDGIVDYLSTGFSTTQLDGGCLQRAFNDAVGFAGEPQILALLTNYVQYANKKKRTSVNNGFRLALEGTPHAAPHVYIGGHMATYFSPDDPIFFLHHANVDRIWSLWQDYQGHDTVTSYLVPTHYEGKDLNVAMPYDGASAWNFELPGNPGNLPTPADMMTNTGYVQVKYVNDFLSLQLATVAGSSSWLNSSWFEMATGLVGTRCLRATSAPSSHPTSSPSVQVDCSVFQRRQVCESASVSGGCQWVGGHCVPATLRRQQQENGIGIQCELVPFNNPDLVISWLQLCDEMPLTTAPDRLVVLATRDCQARGNPRGATPAWISNMELTQHSEVFDCFNPPGE